jgi:hypothetical protein
MLFIKGADKCQMSDVKCQGVKNAIKPSPLPLSSLAYRIVVAILGTSPRHYNQDAHFTALARKNHRQEPSKKTTFPSEHDWYQKTPTLAIPGIKR